MAVSRGWCSPSTTQKGCDNLKCARTVVSYCQFAVFLIMCFVSLYITLCISLLLPAQNNFQAYTPLKGLVDARVHAILPDKMGVKGWYANNNKDH
jgi:hypothetical protein